MNKRVWLYLFVSCDIMGGNTWNHFTTHAYTHTNKQTWRSGQQFLPWKNKVLCRQSVISFPTLAVTCTKCHPTHNATPHLPPPCFDRGLSIFDTMSYYCTAAELDSVVQQNGTLVRLASYCMCLSYPYTFLAASLNVWILDPQPKGKLVLLQSLPTCVLAHHSGGDHKCKNH